MFKPRLLAVLVQIVVSLFLINQLAFDFAATCTGADPCNACKNCKYCRHCAKEGGKCGVCKNSRNGRP
jgi:hypothetical protein